MALLHGANFLSAGQLVVLGWGTSRERAAQMRLKRLHDGGYVDRFRPAHAHGRAEWNYQLTARGFSALKGRSIVSFDGAYTPAALTAISYAEHDLQMAAVVLHIARAAVGESDGALIERMPFEWQGPRNGRIDPGAWGEFKIGPAAKLAPDRRRHHADSREGYLEPDATLTGGSGENVFAVLFEYDRTERAHKQIDRLRRYDGFMLDGWHRSRFAVHALAPTVIFMTAREGPLRALIKAADKTFSAWYGHEHAGPRESTHPARDRVLFTSRERVLSGDWMMQRTPSLPSGLRENPAACWPRSVEYDLPSLLADARRLSSSSDAD